MKYIEYKALYSFDRLNYDRLDPFYDSPTFFLYLTHINYARRRPSTYRLIYRLLFLMKSVGYIPLDFFYQVIKYHWFNIKTVHIEIAGRSHNIPVPITINAGYSMLIRYFINGSHSQTEIRYEQRLLAEFEAMVFYIGKSYGILSIEKMFEQAKEDHIFAHYRWR
jgi:hypothetical protein